MLPCSVEGVEPSFGPALQLVFMNQKDVPLPLRPLVQCTHYPQPGSQAGVPGPDTLEPALPLTLTNSGAKDAMLLSILRSMFLIDPGDDFLHSLSLED